MFLDQGTAAAAVADGAVLSTGALDSILLTHLASLDALKNPLKSDIQGSAEDEALNYKLSAKPLLLFGV